LTTFRPQQAMHNPTLIFNFVTRIFPLVKKELSGWQSFAQISAEAALSEQAQASITSKAFHCLGGSVYALYPGVNPETAVRFITAYQTISDYLDNLVDNVGISNETAFSQLHLAMQEALDPEARTSDYYLYYPFQADGGYLQTLVKTCQSLVAELPSYRVVKSDLLWLAEKYSELQTYKHLSLADRERKLLTWANSHRSEYPANSPWEFSAAAGSTLGVFCLFAAASSPDLAPAQVRQIKQAYFPWICGLHILLDYFIDLREDYETRQLNFVQYYADAGQTLERLNLFRHNSLIAALSLPYPKFHKAVIQGLLAMYLSDQKTSLPQIYPTAHQLLEDGGKTVKTLHLVCSLLRKGKQI